MKDIEGREDIIKLINYFYEIAKQDELIGPFFTQKFVIVWELHLPVMYDFWENVLFFTGNYSGNPMKLHQDIHQKFPFTECDFDRWILLFRRSVDTLFKGKQADTIKQRAYNIAAVMKIKILT